MDKLAQRMAVLGIPLEDAEKLVRAGFDTPAKVRRARDSQLPRGIDKEKLRALLPKLD